MTRTRFPSSLRRRDFLRSSAAAAVLSPFASLLSGEASAQTGPAKYLLVFHTNGTDPGAWAPGNHTESGVNFSAMTQPLSQIADDIVLVDNLSSFGTADNHTAPGGLTGRAAYGNGNISVDQFAARALNAGTPIENLLLGGVPSESPSCFYKDGMTLAPIADPASAYGVIFGGGTPPSGSGDPNALAEQALRRQSILDVMTAELAELSASLGADGRHNLEVHADSIRQFEQRLGGGTDTGTTVPGAGCSPPEGATSAGQDVLNSALHLDLAVNAFACDLTRVAAVQFGHHQNTQVDIPEVGSGNWHNDFLHSGRHEELQRLEAWLCQRFVDAALALKERPAPDGNGSLFDQTLMVWTRDMGDAVNHSGNNMRFVFSGGAGGYLRRATGGRYINGNGERHQKALFSCLSALGITDTTGFGEENVEAGGREPLGALV